MQTVNDVPIILRREIEARFVAPFLEAFSKELGEEKTRKIAELVISKLAEEFGASIAKSVGGNSLPLIKEKVVPMFAAGGALEIEYGESGEERIRWDTTKCAYVDMYKRIGDVGLGVLLSCRRDQALFRGMNPDIRFTRTKTIMEGGDRCDFCLELPKRGA